MITHYQVWPTIGRILIILVIMTAIGGMGMVVWINMKQYIKKKLYLFKRWVEGLQKDFHLIKNIWIVQRNERKHHHSSVVEMTFQVFNHFYESIVNDIGGWAFPEEDFPNGKFDLTSMYRWINKTRKDNWKELESLDFDSYQNCFIWWGSKYQVLNHKIVDGELKIKPDEFSESQNPGTRFQSRLIKIQEDLQQLDYDKVVWILQRRRFFGI